MNYELHEFISCFERRFKFKKKFDVITVDWSFFCNQSIVDPLIRICRSNTFSKYVQLVKCSATLNYLNSFLRELVWFPNEGLRTQVPWSSFKKLKWKKAYKSKLCQVYQEGVLEKICNHWFLYRHISFTKSFMDDLLRNVFVGSGMICSEPSIA